MSDIYLTSNPTGPTVAVVIDESLCIGCNRCAGVCRIQTIMPNPEKGKPPIVVYPDECWYCGVCVGVCPTGALEMRLPINQRVLFKDRENGEVFRIGADDAPKKSYFKAPFGWQDHRELGKIMQYLERDSEKTVALLGKNVGTEIGKFFGEKEAADNTEKLVRFMKKVGFDEVALAGEENAAETLENVHTVAVGTDIAGAEFVLSVSDLSALLHRLCVSNFTAVSVWRDLS